MESAIVEQYADCDLIILHASLGHSFPELIDQAQQLAPRAQIVATSCCGVVGKEGVSESMKDIALMAVRGKEFDVSYVDGIYGQNSYEKTLEMARDLKQKQ